MIEAYAVSDVRAIEAEAMGHLPEGTLMQRAAEGVASVAAARLGERGGSRVVALVGSGDNGGDALYAAARLAADFEVRVVLVGEKAHEAGLEAARSAGVDVILSRRGPVEAMGEADLVIDGILGIGGRPGLRDPAEQLVEAIPDTAYVLAVDLPSGADPAGEQSATNAVFADETVTLGVAKPVHLLPATEPAVGRLTVIDIGLDAALAAVAPTPAVQRLTTDDVADLWPVPGPADDKYSRGVLGVVAGGEGYTGAPVMCVTAAVEAGAGMVRYVGPPTPTALLRAAVPEAVFGEGRVQAWVVGPGLEAGDDSDDGQAQVRAARWALASGRPCLVDAGGLDLFEEADLPLPSPALLTPHAGELARLVSRLGDQGEVSREEVAAAPLRYARQVADRTGATVLLKGSTTLVVPPTSSGLPVRSQSDAPPWLATAGAGDVLAGLAGTLLASGLDLLDTGSLAALVHGLAGAAARPGGPVRATGVAHAIPAVVADLLRR
jgi:hydroxyethylthiazole kinase-like uncharacterized protein yjeF